MRAGESRPIRGVDVQSLEIVLAETVAACAHQPALTDARDDGEHEWTHCQHCLMPMLRDDSGAWRLATIEEFVRHGRNLAERREGGDHLAAGG